MGAVILGPEHTFTDKSLRYIANIIRHDWKKVHYAAEHYLDAMKSLETLNDKYYYDSGASIVSYFLANAQGWRGPVAREVKKELNRRLNIYHNRPTTERVVYKPEDFDLSAILGD